MNEISVELKRDCEGIQIPRIISEGPTLVASRRFQREILLMGRSRQHFPRSLTVFEDRVDEK